MNELTSNKISRRNEKSTVLLFDIDGTLTLPRERIKPSLKEKIKRLSEKYIIALVGGGTYGHISEQIEDLVSICDYIFTENGTKTYKDDEIIYEIEIKNILGEKLLREIIDYCLFYMSNIKLPFKRGTFFELRTGLINICPMGRNCTYNERLEFIEYNNKHKVLERMNDDLKDRFKDYPHLVFSIGSSVSIDLFVEGYRKPFCLRFIDDKRIYFFGDKTFEGGNDYEISIDKRVFQSFTVNSPDETEEILLRFEEGSL